MRTDLLNAPIRRDEKRLDTAEWLDALTYVLGPELEQKVSQHSAELGSDSISWIRDLVR